MQQHRDLVARVRADYGASGDTACVEDTDADMPSAYTKYSVYSVYSVCVSLSRLSHCRDCIRRSHVLSI
jgi:hypothetical protein